MFPEENQCITVFGDPLGHWEPPLSCVGTCSKISLRVAADVLNAASFRDGVFLSEFKEKNQDLNNNQSGTIYVIRLHD